TGQYALFSLFYKKGVDGFYPSTPNIIEPKMIAFASTIYFFTLIKHFTIRFKPSLICAHN
ncbi:hypothetical protein EFS06_12945, partial [Levilactobacillus brevis]|nr:hypothetical protein [Levilactobacillus brevis]